MKKYMTPLFDVLTVQTKDVITVSAGEQGVIKSYSFKDIIADGSEWISN